MLTKRGPVFTFILARGRFAFCTPVSSATVVDVCCILSLYKNRLAGFQGMQSCKIVFVACACKIRCIVHQSCPMKNQHFTPGLGNLFAITTHTLHIVEDRWRAAKINNFIILRFYFRCPKEKRG